MRALGTNRNRPLPTAAEEDAQVLLVLALIASFIPGLVGGLLDSLAAGIAGNAFPAGIARAALSGVALLTRVIGAGILAMLVLGCLWCAAAQVWRAGSDRSWPVAAMYAAGALVAAAGLFVAWAA